LQAWCGSSQPQDPKTPKTHITLPEAAAAPTRCGSGTHVFNYLCKCTLKALLEYEGCGGQLMCAPNQKPKIFRKGQKTCHSKITFWQCFQKCELLCKHKALLFGIKLKFQRSISEFCELEAAQVRTRHQDPPREQVKKPPTREFQEANYTNGQENSRKPFHKNPFFVRQVNNAAATCKVLKLRPKH
jgi:hypothetical protein